MNRQEKTLARNQFKMKIYEANGQKFEDLFTAIMNYSEPDFQQIKPWGRIGDGKNDGYIKSVGIYFQVFAPEDIKKSYNDVINKLEKDFQGLLKEWSPINEFYFVVNDKFDGVSKDCEKKIQEIKVNHKLKNAGFKTPKDLENLLFTLTDDQILSIIHFLPDPSIIKTLDYSILNEVIGFIMGLSYKPADGDKIKMPDWDQKIKFNNLTDRPTKCLNNGYLHVGALEKYLKNNGTFLADELKTKMRELYLFEKEQDKNGDDLFWAIVSQASPKAELSYQTAVIVIMSKYFETCDIFEEPGEPQ